MKISEIFESIQGEGKLMGIPMLFVRMAGCNLSCDWCDTPYAREGGALVTVDELAERILSSKLSHVCWTGGEPLLQREEITETISKCPAKVHCLETNGTIRVPQGVYGHVTISPKQLDSPPQEHADIYKFVVADPIDASLADIQDYVEMHSIPAGMVYLQPECTTRSQALSKGTRIWDECVSRGYGFSPRLHTIFFDNRRCR